MYFLEQIKTQFLSCIALYEGEGASENTTGAKDDRAETPKPENISPEQLAKLETLEGIKKEIEGLNASEKIVGTRIQVIGTHLEKIKNKPSDKASASDPEFAQLLGTYDRLLQEYEGISKDNSQTLHILEFRLREFEGQVDKQIAEIQGAVEEKDFTQGEISELQNTRVSEKEVTQKTFIAFLGAKYAPGTDISSYASSFENTPFEESFKSYLNVLSKENENTSDIQSQGEQLTYDIATLREITTQNTILLRDEKLVDGKKFGEIRDESAQAQLEKFVSETTDPEIKELLTKNGETIKFSELSAANIALLHEKGFDIKPFLFVNEKGVSISTEDYKNGGVFFLNTAGNENLEGILEMNLIDETSKTLKIEGQLASYKTEEPAGYYYPNGEKVILRDGMKIEVSPLGDMTPDEARSSAASTGFKAIMGNEIGAAVQNNSEILQELEKFGPLGKFLGMMLTALGFIKNPDGGGGYGYTDASGNWVPLDGKDFAESARRSEPAERSASGTTLCSRTAFKNLTKLGVDNPHRGASAKDSYEMYGKNGDTSFPKSENAQGAKFADIYLDASPKNAKYGHRAAAFKEGEQWFILDPYYSIPGYPDRQGAIPAEAYLNHMCGSKGRKFWGAQYPDGNSESPSETPVA